MVWANWSIDRPSGRLIVSAAGDGTLRLALRATAEGAEPPQVAVRAGLHDEHVELVVRDPDIMLCQERVDGSDPLQSNKPRPAGIVLGNPNTPGSRRAFPPTA